jgi:ATP-dependent DNA ligase
VLRYTRSELEALLCVQWTVLDPPSRPLASAVHCAFNLLELDGKDLRREPIENRKALLTKLLRGSHSSIVLNEHYEEDGAI